MYLSHVKLAFKKYKWFYAPFFILLIMVWLNFPEYEGYKKFLFNMNFEIADFIYHNILISFVLSIITSITFFILIIFKPELEKDIITVEFLNDLLAMHKTFNADFQEELLEKETLFALRLAEDGNEQLYYDSNGLVRKVRNITSILNHCGMTFRMIEDIFKLGVADAETLRVLKKLKHSKFMTNYEMIYRDIWDKIEIAPFERIGQYDEVGRNKGITDEMEKHKKAYLDYMENFKEISNLIGRLGYFIKTEEKTL